MTDKEKAQAYDEALDRMKYVVVVPKDEKALQALKETIFPELAESEDEKIRKEINILYSDIDTCISELLKARTDKDSEAEGKALFKMEGLMVATLQDLSCIEDYLEKQKEQKSAEWSEEDENNLELVIDCIYKFYPDPVMKYKLKEWLKSLRPQPKQNVSDTVITPNKEFFQWIYDRLVNVHNENPNVDYMISFKRRIEELSVDKPSWKPSEEQMKALEKVRTIFHHYHLWDEINPILYDYEELMRDLQKL